MNSWRNFGHSLRTTGVVSSRLMSGTQIAQISAVIAACEANIHNLSMRMGSPDFHKFVFEIEVRDLAQLSDVIAQLKLTPGISDVHRATVAEANALSNIDWTEELSKEPA